MVGVCRVQLRFDVAAFLLLIAAVVAMLTRRLRMPYSAGLVAVGIAIGIVALPFSPTVGLTKDLIFTGFLPPLVFEAAFSIPWKRLREDLTVIVVLATLGVLLSGAITAFGMHYAARWEWLSCALFGALIAATDPVSVIATFREAGAHGRLRVLVEAESLLNDGTAAVAFGVVAAFAEGGSFSPAAIFPMSLLMVGGGVMCGALVAGLVLALAGHTQDHLVEITFSTVAAYGSFLLADHFHLSGVLATLTAGLMLGSGSSGLISERGREAVQAFWEYAAFVANSFVFLLIGIHGARQNLLVVWFPACIAILLVTLGRAIAIYPSCLLFIRSRCRVSVAHQHVLFWGGLRGALALALALGLPTQVPAREQIITVSFAVVAFSIFVQGLTIKPLLVRLGEVPHSK
jgi:monovalent cation:H+ antiporter, CPA1 family